MKVGRVPGLRSVASRMQRLNGDLVLFDSWHGTYSDNPRAISEELTRRETAIEQVWVADDPAASVPGEISAVAPESWSYLAALGSARYLVSNIGMPGYFSKKPGVTYVQTWHGTPLKRIGFDIRHPIFPGSRRALARLRRDVPNWDFLLSPNRFSTRIFRQAFGYEGEILETGYPRNDVLVSPDAERTRREVRRQLGISDDTCAVLYAPTWRDDAAFSLELDTNVVRAELGESHVVLVRAHHLVANGRVTAAPRPLLDVSVYPDIRDLYLAADVLLTDYSSAMFDFAATRKPMLFFTYDLERYRDEVRGFYFDFEAEAPGPLLSTTAEVCDALERLGEVTERYKPAYECFVRKFGYLDDGKASARVVDMIFPR